MPDHSFVSRHRRASGRLSLWWWCRKSPGLFADKRLAGTGQQPQQTHPPLNRHRTTELTRALSARDSAAALKKLKNHIAAENEHYLKALRTGEGSSSQRMALSALTVMNMHYRDLITQLLSEASRQGIAPTVDDFEFHGCLRHELVPNRPAEECHIRVRLFDATVEFGYEYLGQVPRLVVTEDTAEAFRGVLSAISFGRGACIVSEGLVPVSIHPLITCELTCVGRLVALARVKRPCWTTWRVTVAASSASSSVPRQSTMVACCS